MLHHHPVHQDQNSTFHKILNLIVTLVATASPLITIPQLYDIYSNRTASGVSSATWLMYIFTASIWFTYGVIHREKVIMVNGVLGVILGASIFFGTLLYG